MLEQQDVPDHIIAHSIMVSRVALSLAKLLVTAGVRLNPELVEAGGLLHDISKMECIQKRCDHAARGAELIAVFQYPEVASLVRQHVVLDRPVSMISCPNDAMVLNYADKRVKHSEFVSLADRFEDLRERYGTTRKRKKRIESMYGETCDMEYLIFSMLQIRPEELEPAVLHEQ